MSAGAPAVSIVVIAFNERANGPTCVRSILDQQTDAEFDLVFVDDGSTDGTAEAVTEAAGGDPRFRLVRLSENRGRGAARAAGVEAATGRAIGFVDADITLPPAWLRRCLDDLPGHAAVGGIAVPDGDAVVIARVSGAAPRVRGGRTPITGNNLLFDRAIFSQFGFDPHDRLGEDTRLVNRMLRAGYRLRRVPGLTVAHNEAKNYGQALRWRFENGIDASSLPRELGVVRAADLAWGTWFGALAIGILGTLLGHPAGLILVPLASVAGGVIHVHTRFRARPFGKFLLACVAGVPLFTAYVVGRTVGIPRLLRGRG